ncbi:hypothetical protein ACQJBY_014006 [Aegilops geniculata]
MTDSSSKPASIFLGSNKGTSVTKLTNQAITCRTLTSFQPVLIFAKLKHQFCLLSLACRGTDVSIENMHDGYRHVFESTFESTEGVKEYVYHPAHVEFATDFLSSTEKVLIIDFKPAAGN